MPMTSPPDVVIPGLDTHFFLKPASAVVECTDDIEPGQLTMQAQIPGSPASSRPADSTQQICALHEVMSPAERITALAKMKASAANFYASAVGIGVHPFIEFAGLMNEYIKACENANRNGLDFSQFNTHTGMALPLAEHEIDYINEKLDCIFTGRILVK